MTREAAWRIYRQMELLRHEANEAVGEDKARILNEYTILWSIVKPYVDGTMEYVK